MPGFSNDVMYAGTISATTFKIRIGNSVGGGVGFYVNGGWDIGTGAVIQLYEGRGATALTITEYRNTSA